MTINLGTNNPANVPLPQIISSSNYKYLDDYDLTTGLPSLVSARSIITGDTVWSNDFNRNAAYLDVISQYGSGLIGIVHGFAVSAGSGLNATVTAGGAIIEGVIQNKTSSTVLCNDNATNYLWFRRDGTFEVKSTNANPTTPGVFLAIVTTSGGAITQIDASGVCYVRGGLLYRETADLYAPQDTPSASVIVVTKTLSGFYIWCGAEWDRLTQETAVVENVTANRSDTGIHRNRITTNVGAGSKPIITLETASTGIIRTFIVDNANGIRVEANTGDTIRVGANVSASAGYAESTTVGNTLCLVAINATEWIALYSTGTWTVV